LGRREYIIPPYLDINIPMVQGMPFFTVELNGIAPNLRTIAAVISVRNPSGKFAPGQAVPPSNWFTIELNSGLFWVLYSSVPVALSTTGSSVSFPQAVTGYVRIGCIGSTDIVEQLLPFLPTYPTSGDVDYTFTDDHYILNFDFETKGQGELLMMALPHHMDLIQNP
jgi:endo-1,3(4)-beta-glucanase